MGDAGDKGTQPERFGPYEVHERLGIGGMAIVHLARERGVEGFERWVALKRLLPQFGLDEEFVAAFVREAQLACRLSHPNIVRIFELGRVGEDYFISMEYIEGRDIRLLLRQARKVAGPPPLTVTCCLLSELLDALDYAHRKTDASGRPLGLIHRDVSPSNLLVDSSGLLKIIDFGIAKATSQKQLTQAGKIKGKLAYMAPEALKGEPRDARSDLFSVGVIAHELLTVRPLFGAPNDYQTIQRILNAEVLPPSAQNTNCPPELDEWVLKGLARDRSERWQSAREMLDALGDVCRAYHLHATNRDVAGWIEWAFSLPEPSRGRHEELTLELPERRRRKRMPTVAEAEAEVLDIFWGDPGGPQEPLKLDELEVEMIAEGDESDATDPLTPEPVLFAVGPESRAAAEAIDRTEPGGWIDELFDDTEPSQMSPAPPVAEPEEQPEGSKEPAEEPEEPVVLLETRRRKRITDKVVPPPPRPVAPSFAPHPDPPPASGGREMERLSEERAPEASVAPPQPQPQPQPPPRRQAPSVAPPPQPPAPRRQAPSVAPPPQPAPSSVLLPAILIGLAGAALVGSVIAYFVWSPSASGPAAPPAADAAAAPVAVDAARAQNSAADAAPVAEAPERTAGELPRLEAGAGPAPEAVNARICIDRRGAVESVRVLGDVGDRVNRAVTRAVSEWRYRPYRLDYKPVPACFQERIPVAAP